MDSAMPRRATLSRISAITVVGIVFIMLGVAGLSWVGWQYYGTNITSNRAFNQEREWLREQWKNPRASSIEQVVLGDAIALLRIPQLGESYEYPIVVGIGEEELARGVGWYPNTAQPGQLGNFAVAAHRITHGEPFARLLELGAGSTVVIETGTHIYTYELTTSPADLTVGDSETWVVDPVPGKPIGTTPTEAVITLTTCTDLFASPKRSVAFGHLVKADVKG
ncbi:MAG: class E sortase [Propionibacteriaceae bacterium]